MKAGFHQGTLKVWKSDRGFGFIKPDDGSADIFLHISSVERAVREPAVGDTILYIPARQKDGRTRAIKASIQGVAPKPKDIPLKSPPSNRSSRTRKQRQPIDRLLAFGGALLGVVLLVFAIAPTYKNTTKHSSDGNTTAISSKVTAQVNPNCNIKGNISWNAEIKYYHLPGMEDYEETQINLEKGERWFCSEAEAQAAGWMKAPTP